MIYKTTKIKPTIKEIEPEIIDLFLNLTTVLSSTILIGVGKAPDLNNKAKSVTC